MSGCSLCGGGVKEGFYGEISLEQRARMFADKNKGSICWCTIILIVALFFILRKK